MNINIPNYIYKHNTILTYTLNIQDYIFQLTLTMNPLKSTMMNEICKTKLSLGKATEIKNLSKGKYIHCY